MAGWVGVALVTLVYDTWAIKTRKPTMSSVARQHRLLTALGIGVLGAHLLG